MTVTRWFVKSSRMREQGTPAGRRSVVIIGAAAAGSAAAVLLARGGAQVTVIERASFPRAKVCGEFIAPAANASLLRMVSERQLLRAGAERVGRLVLEAAGERMSVELGEPGWGLSRGSLDSVLLAEAMREGAEVLQPRSVRSVMAGRDGVEVVLADGERVAAEVVIHADGWGRLDAAGPTSTRRGVVGVKCHFAAEGRERGTVVMRSVRGGYVGTIEVEGGLGTCAAVLRHEVVKEAGGDVEEAVRRVWPDAAGLKRVGEWMSCGVALGAYRRPGGLRSLRIGNAAAAVDPVGGEGIGLALWSGAKAAEGLIRQRVWDAAGVSQAEAELGEAYGARLRWRRVACASAAWVLERPWAMKMAMRWTSWAWGDGMTGAMRAWARLSGKPA